MKRALFGSMALLLTAAASAWGQGAVPRVRPARDNSLVLLSLLVPTVGFVLLVVSVARRQKTQTAVVARSLELSEERLRLARRQIALQEETNRLLEQLISGQDYADPV
jgi:hypothetical protein